MKTVELTMGAILEAFLKCLIEKNTESKPTENKAEPPPEDKLTVIAGGYGIGIAVGAMFYGHKVARKGWNDKGMWLALQVTDTDSKMSLPYVYMKTADGKLVPWLCSQSDLLTTDWIIYSK
jgi:hypothetical protein